MENGGTKLRAGIRFCQKLVDSRFVTMTSIVIDSKIGIQENEIHCDKIMTPFKFSIEF